MSLPDLPERAGIKAVKQVTGKVSRMVTLRTSTHSLPSLSATVRFGKIDTSGRWVSSGDNCELSFF